MTEKTDGPILVTTTFEDSDQAEKLAAVLLQDRLIACGQISGPMTSSYWWNGNITTSTEYVLSMKTMSGLYPRLEGVIKANHPYEVPEIMSVPITHVSRDYLNWMLQELAE